LAKLLAVFPELAGLKQSQLFTAKVKKLFLACQHLSDFSLDFSAASNGTNVVTLDDYRLFTVHLYFCTFLLVYIYLLIRGCHNGCFHNGPYIKPERLMMRMMMMMVVIDTGMHCTECGYNCHEKCVQHVPKNCTKLRPASHLTSLSSDQAAAGSTANIQSVTAAESATDATLVGSVTQSAVSTSTGSLNMQVSTSTGSLCCPSS